MQTIGSQTTGTTNTAKEGIAKKLGVNSDTCDVIQQKSGDVARDFRSFVHDVENLLKSTTDMGGEDFARAKAKLNERVTAAKKNLESLSAAISESASKGAATANSYVHEQPWPVIGASAALGFIAGYLLTNRSSD